MELFDVRLLGVSTESAQKLAFTAILIIAVVILRRLLKASTWLFFRNRENDQARFWFRQATNAAMTLIALLGTLSIWFEDPNRLAAAWA